LAGLTAARILVERGASVAVLEARDRVGGRTLSHVTPDGDTVDLGAQWIGPTQDRVRALAGEAGARTFTQFTHGRKLMSLDGRIASFAGGIPSLPLLSLLSLQRLFGRLDGLSQQVPLDAPHTAARAAEWDGVTVETWKQSSVATRATRSLLDVAVRAVFAAEPAELSFLGFLFYLRSGGGLRRLTSANDGAQQTRFAHGTQALSLHLAAGLGDRVRLQAPVRAIAQTGTGVQVRADGATLDASRVIVAVPPPLAARIDYDPPLPPARDQLTQRLPMGSVIKCIACYKRPFWRDAGLSGEAISNTGPVTLIVDDSPEDAGHGALLGFVMAGQARTLSSVSAEERRGAVIDSFVRFFGSRAAAPDYYVERDWAQDPWSRGCYTSLFLPGVLTGYGDALRAPVGRIHWAGTETASVWNGYMDGAIESGERAAGEVLARM
jgi:monoamine oxidase